MSYSDEIKTELGKKLKEHIDNLLDKIRESIEKGKGLREETLEKVNVFSLRYLNLPNVEFDSEEIHIIINISNCIVQINYNSSL